MASTKYSISWISFLQFIASVSADAGAACSQIPDNCTIGFNCRRLVVNGLKQSICVSDGCFPGDAMVYMHDGEVKSMKDLKLGDKVATGKNVYSQIYAFGHKSPHAVAEFVQLRTETTVLEVTSGHFVPITVNKKILYKRANDLNVGDILSTEQGFSRITGVSKVEKLGLYNPFTLSGHILVNNAVVSVHSEWFLDNLFDLLGASHYLPFTYQLLLAPVRVLHSFAGDELYSKWYNMLESFINVK